jgi:hypothetical protein
MRRRDFITLLGGAAAAWPRAARAQQAGKVARVGVLGASVENPTNGPGITIFLSELRKLGFTEGHNLVVEYKQTDEGTPKAFAAANELGAAKAEVIVASGTEITLQAAWLAADDESQVRQYGAQYIAVRSIVDRAADVRRTSTSSVYRTPGVPRRSSSPLGIDSTRQARAAVRAGSFMSCRSIEPDCCARDVSGHVAATPPRRVMNCRRFTFNRLRRIYACRASRICLATSVSSR